jgi:heme-degrading monooxygenase HmoA
MVARVTAAEIDTLRIDIETAVQRFRDLILPPLREQAGYRGVYALSTPEGRALVVTFWESEEAADAGLASGFYSGQLEAFVTFYRSPPGRELYDVLVAELPDRAGV